MWCAVRAHRVGCQVVQWTILFLVLLASILIVLAEGSPSLFAQSAEASPMKVTLPQSAGVWTRSQPPKRIEAKEIFDYMDGAGELYLGYRFDHLDVYEYESPKDDNILVELYWMKSSDDAYGLLSGDWGGEAIDTGQGRTLGPARALYGAGLLRIWSGNLYARIMAYQETDAAKLAVLSLGKAIVEGRSNPAPPQLAQALPANVDKRFALRSDRSVFLRSHLVLNSVYFMSPENLLDLGLDCEVVAGPYSAGDAGQPKQVRLLLARYPSQAAAEKALAHFQTVYLAGKSGKPATGNNGAVSIEDGWAGFVLVGRGIGLVFEAPDEPSTRLFLENAKQALEKVEGLHE